MIVVTDQPPVNFAVFFWNMLHNTSLVSKRRGKLYNPGELGKALSLPVPAQELS